MSFDDLPLSRPPAPERPPRRPAESPTSRWVIAGAGAVVAGVALTLWWMSRAQTPAVIPAPTAATDPAAQGSRRPSREPMELPALSNSDAMLRELASTLSHNPLLARLVATRSIVNNAVLTVVQIGDGKTPAVPLAVLRPPIRLDIAGQASGRVVAPSFARWEAATNALLSIPTADAARVYVNVKPLFDEAYRDLGYPNGDFDVAIAKAIRTLDATPPSPPDLVLYRREGYFEHADSTLQSLQPVQKQLLLLGPANRARIQAWLHQLAAALDLKIG